MACVFTRPNHPRDDNGGSEPIILGHDSVLTRVMSLQELLTAMKWRLSGRVTG